MGVGNICRLCGVVISVVIMSVVIVCVLIINVLGSQSIFFCYVVNSYDFH